ITPDETYRFVDSGTNLRDRGDQSRNFFMNHPEGRLEIAWDQGVDAQSQLETFGQRQIARRRFTSTASKEVRECNLISSAESRRLCIVAPSFEMDAGWLHHWSKAGGASGEG